MKYQRIVFSSPCVAELEEYELAPLQEDEVEIRLAVSTISSGTERANLVGDDTVNAGPPMVRFPRYVGYSSTGTVTAVGEKVKSVAVGDRVVCSWGTHSQVIHLKESRVQKIGEASFEEAALWHIATFPMAAIRKCGLEIGESAVVMGLGILGMMAVGLLHAAGAVPVIAVDPIEEKRKQALAFGADYALDPFEEGFAERVKELTGKGANVAIEVTGNGKALDQVLDAMAKMGRVALLGCTRHSDFTIDYYRKVHSPGISLIGAHTMARPKKESSRGLWADRDDIFACRKLFERGRIRFSELLQESYSPAEAPEVYRRLAEEKSFPVTQFDWRKLP